MIAPHAIALMEVHTHLEGVLLYRFMPQHFDHFDIWWGAEKGVRSRSERIAAAQHFLEEHDAPYVVCDTPQMVRLARRAGRKVCCYFTEFYPSKKNLRNCPLLLRPVKALILFTAFLYAGWAADSIAVAEYYKRRWVQCWFPGKRLLRFSYAPDAAFFPEREIAPHPFTVYYSGPLTKEKGWFRVKRLVERLATEHPEHTICLRYLGEEHPALAPLPNLSLAYSPELEYPDFCLALQEVDLGVDLRDNDCENTHCTPLKLYHFLAAHKPFIYTNLRAIDRDLPEAQAHGLLVSPDDETTIYRYAQQLMHTL